MSVGLSYLSWLACIRIPFPDSLAEMRCVRVETFAPKIHVGNSCAFWRDMNLYLSDTRNTQLGTRTELGDRLVTQVLSVIP